MKSAGILNEDETHTIESTLRGPLEQWVSSGRYVCSRIWSIGVILFQFECIFRVKLNVGPMALRQSHAIRSEIKYKSRKKSTTNGHMTEARRRKRQWKRNKNVVREKSHSKCDPTREKIAEHEERTMERMGKSMKWARRVQTIGHFSWIYCRHGRQEEKEGTTNKQTAHWTNK